MGLLKEQEFMLVRLTSVPFDKFECHQRAIYKCDEVVGCAQTNIKSVHQYGTAPWKIEGDMTPIDVTLFAEH